jgi:hypothetical protein
MTAVTAPAPAPARTHPDLEDATRVVLRGQIMWLPYAWLAGTLVFAALLIGVGRWGTVDDSLWPIGASWQRYLFFAAGVMTMTVFLRLLVRNGATRRLTSSATTVAGAGLAAFIGLWNVAGYSIEALVYHHQGWPQRLPSGRLFEWGDLPAVFVSATLIVAAYYVSGWIVAAGFVRHGGVGGMLRLIPGLLPAAAMELVISPDFGGAGTTLWTSWRAHVVPMLAIGLAVLALSVAVARRITRETALG